MPQGGDQMLMMQALTDSGFLVKHELMWLKNNHVLGRADYNYKHEPICYGWTSKGKHKFYATEFKTSVLEFDKPSSSKLHPTMKPLELLNELICNSTDKNMVVYDPTAGSGSTLIACEQAKRKNCSIELEPKYCDVIIDRWCKYTGITDIVRNNQPFKWKLLD
jgi:DNA modification methylase